LQSLIPLAVLPLYSVGLSRQDIEFGKHGKLMYLVNVLYNASNIIVFRYDTAAMRDEWFDAFLTSSQQGEALQHAGSEETEDHAAVKITLEEKIAKSKDDVQTAQREYNTITRELDTTKRKLAKIQTELKEATGEVSDLESELKSWQGKNGQFELRTREADDEVEENTKVIDELSKVDEGSETERLESDISDTVKTAKKVQQEIDDSSEELSTLRQRRKDLMAERSKLQAAKQELWTELIELRSTHDQRTSEFEKKKGSLASAKKEIEEGTKVVEEMHEKLGALEKEKVDVDENVREKKIEVESLKERGLQDAIASTKDALDNFCRH
jgi:chromosome segregation ATPase